MSGIRFAKIGTLKRMTVGTDGRLSVGSSTSISCALWRRRRKHVVGNVGEANQVTAIAFVPSGTDVVLRDQLSVAGENFSVVNVVPSDDDRGRLDHIGLELEDA